MLLFVMPGFVPGIHVFFRDQGVDGRVKPGHDSGDNERTYSTVRLAILLNFFITRSRFSFER
jgi:hypothetical protein